MTTNTNTIKIITVSLVDAEDESVSAEYYVIEDGWVTFKSADHQFVASYPASRVNRIKSESANGPQVHVSVGNINPETLQKVARESARNAGRWGAQ